MVPIINNICGDLKTYASKLVSESKNVDTKELFSHAAFETIMSTGFGVDVNAWNDKENKFKKAAWTYMGYAGNTTNKHKLWGGRDRTRVAKSIGFKSTLPCPFALTDI